MGWISRLQVQRKKSLILVWFLALTQLEWEEMNPTQHPSNATDQQDLKALQPSPNHSWSTLTGRKEAILWCCHPHGSSGADVWHLWASRDGWLDNGLPRGRSECSNSHPTSSAEAPWVTLFPLFSSITGRMTLCSLALVRNQMRGNMMRMRKALGGSEGKSCPAPALAFWLSVSSAVLNILFNSVFSADTCWPLAEGYCGPYTKLSCLKGFHNLGSYYL